MIRFGQHRVKLIAGDVQVSDEDIDRGYKSNYGPKAQIRAIVLDSQRRAQEVWQKARDNPSIDFFGKLAEQYSIEPASQNQRRTRAADASVQRSA